MINESAKGAFDAVIVWKLDRFARNRYDSAHYKAAFRKNEESYLSNRGNLRGRGGRKYVGEYRYRDVIVSDGVSAIISKELFALAQDRPEKNRYAQ